MDISCQRNDPHVPILIIYLLVKCKANGPALVQEGGGNNNTSQNTKYNLTVKLNNCHLPLLEL